MGEVIEQINQASAHKEAVIVTDVRATSNGHLQVRQISKSKRNVTSGGAGTMGFALPAAIGAKMGAMDRRMTLPLSGMVATR